jgi:hypothetical protein
MPLTAPLSLWVVYAAEKGDVNEVTDYTFGLLIGVIPTVIFIIAAWLTARAGYKLAPIIGVGYVAWIVSLGMILGLRRFLG